jgi:hypothetical protein
MRSVVSTRLVDLAIALLLGGTANGSIEFSDTTSERVLAGIRFTQLTFKENGRIITYEQPVGWNYFLDGSRIRFTPRNTGQASADIDQSRLSQPRTFDDETLKQLRAKTFTLLPSGSLKATIVAEAANPVLVNNLQTYEFIVSYEAFDQESMMSVIYLNLPDTEVRFRTIARKPDFEKIHTAFRGSIFSWQWH